MPLASDRRIMKPVRLLKQQFARRYSDEKNAPAPCAEINRDVERVGHCGLRIADCGLRIAEISHRATETQSKSTEDGFHLSMLFSVALWLCGQTLSQSSILDSRKE
jgi:hypothetical protein